MITHQAQDAFAAALSEIHADWTPSPQDYADLDAAIAAEEAEYALSYGDYAELTFDPDRGW